jgi:uncharacterized protein YjbI with pentapeptide repeats
MNRLFTTLSLLGLASLLFLGILQQNNIDLLSKKIQDLSVEVSNDRIIVDERLKLKKDILGFEKDKAIIKSGIYSSFVQILGGVVLSITAYVGWKNFKIAEDKQVTERFSKAIEHLGSDKLNIRLGGIYALEQIAKDSPEKYHWTITTILANFICDMCPNSSLISSEPISSRTQSDAKSALIVLGRRSINQDTKEEFINLRNIKLVNVEIQGANFSNADFSDSDLSGADLRDTTLNGVKFRKTNLSNVNFKDTNLSDADLRNANLRNAKLNGTQLPKAKLMGADLSDADLTSANLNGADLSNCLLVKSKLIDTDLITADLSYSDLMGADFTRTKLIGTDLRGAISFERTQLSSAIYDPTTKLPDNLNGIL